ncbi:MAG TPA: acyl-CoA dehydrogenase [Pedomonas sp.]|uniref:acyl-CoA dehydrogenase n=1 Tax=Pedomonas sp. TaxID=2976421 RepID=UPI002F408C9E
MTYQAPIREQKFVLETIADIDELSNLPGFGDLSADLVSVIVDEAGKFAEDVWAPLNRVGDEQGAQWNDGTVTLPPGFKEAYGRYVEAGWGSLSAGTEYGGQGLPFVLSLAVQESLTSANLAFSLCPMLTLGAIEAIEAHASEELKQTYLPKVVNGAWAATMNLTEPQAGSDVGALKTKAEPQPDGTYRIKGQKIFITFGEHDLSENIVHLVLARTPGAPAGTKGISLFIVPKFLVNPDGTLGARNDLRCVSIEHKLGIHASPTCVMSYGDNDGCVGYLVGEENTGMRAMFTMMNHARINVGLQGVAIAERAYQGAVAYAKERVQSARLGAARTPVRIIEHADVRRMLLTMKARTEAVRALTYCNAAAVDRGIHAADEETRKAARGLADLLTPLTKSYATDTGVEVASLAIQVFGGMGFIEETGAAQHLRDARITPIYEGTNGIQALDLVGRKLPMDGGAHWQKLFTDIRSFTDTLPGDGAVATLKAPLAEAVSSLEEATHWLVNHANQPDDVAGSATPYQRLFASVVGAYLLARQAVEADRRLGAGEAEADFLNAKVITARFYAEQILPQDVALLGPVTRGADLLYALSEDQFLAA